MMAEGLHLEWILYYPTDTLWDVNVFLDHQLDDNRTKKQRGMSNKLSRRSHTTTEDMWQKCTGRQLSVYYKTGLHNPTCWCSPCLDTQLKWKCYLGEVPDKGHFTWQGKAVSVQGRHFLSCIYIFYSCRGESSQWPWWCKDSMWTKLRS